MRKLLLLSTIALLPCAAASDASAGSITIIGSYTISETYGDQPAWYGGGPTITGDTSFATGITNTDTGTSGNFSFILPTDGTWTTPVNLATFVPDPICEGCAGSSGMKIDPTTISFTFASPSGTAVATDAATFTASYLPPALPCAIGPGPQTACIDWGSSPIVADFTDGTMMDIQFVNTSQNGWDITPTIAFSLIDAPVITGVPEPATPAILGVGLLGLLAARRRVA